MLIGFNSYLNKIKALLRLNFQKTDYLLILAE